MYVAPHCLFTASVDNNTRHDDTRVLTIDFVQACTNAIGSAEFYDHAKTEQWNSTIIVSGTRLLHLLSRLLASSPPRNIFINTRSRAPC